jgi:septum formation protein
VLRTRPDLAGAYLIAADTVVSVGRRILPKCDLADEAEQCLRLLSGRAHRVHTGLSLVMPNGAKRRRLVETRVRFKRLTRADMDTYVASDEWRGKAGGYAIQGRAAAYIRSLSGSYANVVGLSLYDVKQLLVGLGYR